MSGWLRARLAAAGGIVALAGVATFPLLATPWGG